MAKTIKEVAVQVLTDAKILMENQPKLNSEIEKILEEYEKNKTDIKNLNFK